MQLVERSLEQVLNCRRRFDTTVVDRNQQCLDVMTQVTHGGDTRHARTTFQRVQVALEFIHRLRRTLLHPVDKSLVCRFEQLGRFLGEDSGNFGVVFGLVRDNLDDRLDNLGFGGFWRGRFRLGTRRFGHARYRGTGDRIGQIAKMVDQCRVVGAITAGVIDVPDNRLDRPARCLERVEPGLLETDLVIVNATHKAIEGCGNGHTAFDVGHVGAAMQRVAGPMQLVGDVEWRRVPLARGQVIGNDFEVSGRFLREDVVKDRIHLERRLLLDRFFGSRASYLQNGSIGIAFSECVGTCDQQADVSFGLAANFELLDKFGYSSSRLQNKVHHGRRARQRPIDQAIEQILDSPAVFADTLRTNHAAAALERVERAPHRYQHLHIVRRVRPLRQMALDRGDFLLGLLNEQFEKLRIEMLGILCHDRQRHHFGRLHLRGPGLHFVECLLRLGLNVCNGEALRRLNRLLFGFGELDLA